MKKRDLKEDRKRALMWKERFDSKEFGEKFHYTGNDLGAQYAKDKTVFKVWAPTASSVYLNLYKTGSDFSEGAGLISRSPMELQKQGVWAHVSQGDLDGIYYTYTVYAEGESHETGDIYAKACGVNGKRSMVVDLEKTNPLGWQEDKGFRKAVESPVIYEVHVKDFTNDESCGVPKEHRGRFLGFTHKNTCYLKPGQPTCLAYLKELGVTHVHLLPIFDFGSVDEERKDGEAFNWGYDPVNYNVPEGSYSTNPFDGHVRIKECKEMISALHEAGIQVVMDVVYNHTFKLDSWFQYTVPFYYYRINEKGDFSDGSICGNDTKSESFMFRKYMTDSVLYWAREYHIDGFRFDLMGLHDTRTMNQIRRALDEIPGGERILMYGEPWSGDYSPMRKGSVPCVKENIEKLSEGISIFCDDTRDSIKGSVFFPDEPGFVNGARKLEKSIASSVCGWCDGAGGFKPKGPGQIISYVSAHDNYTLWDKLVYTLMDTPDFEKRDETVLRRNKMAAGIYFTCLGIPFFQAGEEGARTKLGEGNSYQSPPGLNQINWKRIYEYKDLVEYYKGLIAIRKGFKAFQRKDREVLNELQFVKMPLAHMVAFRLKGNKEEENWTELFVIYNGNKRKTVIDVPEGDWEVLCDGNQTLHYTQAEKQRIVNEFSVMILGKKADLVV